MDTKAIQSLLHTILCLGASSQTSSKGSALKGDMLFGLVTLGSKGFTGECQRCGEKGYGDLGCQNNGQV